MSARENTMAGCKRSKCFQEETWQNHTSSLCGGGSQSPLALPIRQVLKKLSLDMIYLFKNYYWFALLKLVDKVTIPVFDKF